LPALGRVVAALALLVSFSAPTWAADPATARRLMDIDARLTRLEGVLNNEVLLEMLQRIDTLQRELQAVRDTTDRTAHELEIVKARQRELYLGIDKRLWALETAKSEPAKGPSRPPPAASTALERISPPLDQRPAGGRSPSAVRADIPPRPDVAPPTGGGASNRGATTDDRAYHSAFNLLKNGRNEEAIAALNQFLASYPQSEYAANAQYWLAEANYASGDFDRAARAFKRVISEYPGSSKAPDAKLKLGFTFYELEQWERAREVLSELNAQYPNSSVAQLAENRLQRMGREGR
jgi:tol-pal system protein YbgF